jgi:putative addiction module killer protein
MTQAILYKRIRQAGLGNFGKTRSLDSGVHELKIDYGPGYRLYYGIHNDEIILLLMGGNKRTQKIDIEKAKNHWEQWQEEHDKN